MDASKPEADLEPVEPICGYCMARPTRMLRFWRWCGFVYHLGNESEMPAGIEMKGWFQTRSGIHFDWKDRLRILVSGHLTLKYTYDIDTPTPNHLLTRFDWEIVEPGGKR